MNPWGQHQTGLQNVAGSANVPANLIKFRELVMIEKREFYINGKWVAPAKARDCDVIDPSTEEVCAVISLGDQADTDAAVASANATFPAWAATDPQA